MTPARSALVMALRVWSFRLAIEVAARGGESVTRWVKVTAFGLLAVRTAESVRRGDRLTVTADDFIAEAWVGDNGNGEPRGRITLRARDIAASMARDGLRTGYTARRDSRLAAANGQHTDLPAHEAAEAQVLAGVTAS